MSVDGGGGVRWFVGIVVAVAAGIVVPLYLARRDDGFDVGTDAASERVATTATPARTERRAPSPQPRQTPEMDTPAEAKRTDEPRTATPAPPRTEGPAGAVTQETPAPSGSERPPEKAPPETAGTTTGPTTSTPGTTTEETGAGEVAPDTETPPPTERPAVSERPGGAPAAESGADENPSTGAEAPAEAGAPPQTGGSTEEPIETQRGETAGRTTGSQAAAPAAPADSVEVGEAGQIARLDVSRTSGPVGTTVVVDGEGFKPGEPIVFRLHTLEVGRTKADGAGSFDDVEVTVPEELRSLAPGQLPLVARGEESSRSARVSFTLST